MWTRREDERQWEQLCLFLAGVILKVNAGSGDLWPAIGAPDVVKAVNEYTSRVAA
jgi:hypothetical protein